MKFLFIFLFTINTLSIFSQLPRCYTYDSAGNRTTKAVCPTARIDVEPDDKIALEQIENRSSNEPNVLVYPNPTNGLINIKVRGLSAQTRWSLIAMNGSEVIKDQPLVSSEHDLSHLPAGTYHMRWVDGKKPEIISIIIINE